MAIVVGLCMLSAIRTAAANAPPSVPVIDNPSDHGGATTTTPVFSWMASTDPEGDAITYDVEVDDVGFTVIGAVSGVEGTVTSIPVELENRVTYIWHVRAVDVRGAASDWSPPATFTIIADPGGPPEVIPQPGETCDAGGGGLAAGAALAVALLLALRPRRRPAAAITALLLTAAAAADAHADAMLVRGDHRAFPTAIDVDVTVHAQVESTTYVLAFAPLADDGTYALTVPAPADARPIGVDVDRGLGFAPIPVEAGAPPPAAGGTGDASLADWAGTAPLVAVLRDLAPGPLTVRVRFVRLLRRVGGEVAFDVGVRRCPARDAYEPPPQVQLRVRVDTARELLAFGATGGTATTVTQTARTGTLVTARAPLGLEELLHVRYRESGGGIHAQLLAHRTPTADPMGGTAGYFLLLVDADDVGAGVPRTIGLVVDRSGSMAGDKLAQAKEAARLLLARLGADDRFALHAFDDEVSSFRPAPLAATPAAIVDARAWVDGLAIGGGTNLDGGLQAGLGDRADDGRFDAVILLSDGMATAGVLDDREILRRATARAAERTRIFTVSVGTDADFPLMEALARQNRGRHLDLNDLQATRELARRVRELLEDLHAVRLTDLELTVAGIDAADTLPGSPPDLFAGGQVVIIGRYRQPGTAEVTVRGREGATPFTSTLTFDAPALSETDDIIRFVWASEQVRALMASLAEGADPEAVRAQVTALGLAYRMQTPYTRFAGEPVDDPIVHVGDGGACTAARSPTSAPPLLLALLLLARRRSRAA